MIIAPPLFDAIESGDAPLPLEITSQKPLSTFVQHDGAKCREIRLTASGFAPVTNSTGKVNPDRPNQVPERTAVQVDRDPHVAERVPLLLAAMSM